jgi:Ni,Fe-hydrogenase III large subunit
LPEKSGLARDPFRIVTRPEGDVAARAHLRVDEARVARTRIQACLDEGLPRLPSSVNVAADATGEGFGWAEGARGEVLHYARIAQGRVARLKVRSPSRMNWAAVPLAVPGNIVPDFPLINKSFNLSYAGCDL